MLVFKDIPTEHREEVHYTYSNGDERHHLGDLVQEVDGFYYFNPVERRAGLLSQNVLAGILEELKRLNTEWDNQVGELHNVTND